MASGIALNNVIGPAPATTAETRQGFLCTVDGLPDIQGWLSIGQSSGALQGVVVFFAGLSGTGWWSSGSGGTTLASAAAMQAELRASGFMTIQVRFKAPGWISSNPGQDFGMAVVAERGAVLLRFLHDHYGPDVPFVATGNSAGNGLIGYSLARYGCGDVIDRAVLTSGPPLTKVRQWCLRDPAWHVGPWTLVDQARGHVDANGQPTKTGPCWLADASYSAAWDVEGVDGQTIYDYPTTAVHFIWGSLDNTGAVKHGKVYRDLITSPWTEVTVAAPHAIQETAAGLDSVKQAVLAAVDTGGC